MDLAVQDGIAPLQEHCRTGLAGLTDSLSRVVEHNLHDSASVAAGFDPAESVVAIVVAEFAAVAFAAAESVAAESVAAGIVAESAVDIAVVEYAIHTTAR